jgi:hypothetical protein
VIAADDDVVRQEHYLAIFRHLPRAQLFIVPGATHSGLPTHDLFNQVVERFLDQPFARPTSPR